MWWVADQNKGNRWESCCWPLLSVCLLSEMPQIVHVGQCRSWSGIQRNCVGRHCFEARSRPSYDGHCLAESWRPRPPSFSQRSSLPRCLEMDESAHHTSTSLIARNWTLAASGWGSCCGGPVNGVPFQGHSTQRQTSLVQEHWPMLVGSICLESTCCRQQGSQIKPVHANREEKPLRSYAWVGELWQSCFTTSSNRSCGLSSKMLSFSVWREEIKQTLPDCKGVSRHCQQRHGMAPMLLLSCCLFPWSESSYSPRPQRCIHQTPERCCFTGMQGFVLTPRSGSNHRQGCKNYEVDFHADCAAFLIRSSFSAWRRSAFAAVHENRNTNGKESLFSCSERFLLLRFTYRPKNFGMEWKSGVSRAWTSLPEKWRHVALSCFQLLFGVHPAPHPTKYWIPVRYLLLDYPKARI